jgi:hypothetical protein
MKQLLAWQRKGLSAAELKVTEPDPAILAKALVRMTAGVVELDSAMTLRVGLARLQLEIDVLPTKENVDKFYRLMLAEMQSRALLELPEEKEKEKKKKGKREKGGGSKGEQTRGEWRQRPDDNGNWL